MFAHRPADDLDLQGASPEDPRPAETHERRVERLFREHNESLLRVLRARLRSREEARDVAQEAYVQLLGLDHPESVNFLKGYLFRTATNLAKNRVQQRRTRQRTDELVFFDSDGAVECRSPERIWTGNGEILAIYDALKALPSKCRESFRLVRIEGLSVTQTGEQLNVSSRLVRRYVARAVAHCATALESAATRGEDR